MGIAELKIQPNWLLTVVVEDDRVGHFYVGPTFKTKRLKRFKTKMNSLKLSMVVTLIEWDCGADLSADTIEARWHIFGDTHLQQLSLLDSFNA